MSVSPGEPEGESRRRLRLCGELLIPAMVQDLTAGGGNPTGAAFRALHAQLFERFSEAYAGILLKPPKIRPEAGPSSGGPATLPSLAKTGLEYWYLEISLASPKDAAVDNLEVVGDELLEVVPFPCSDAVSRPVMVKTVAKKTQTNRVVRINHLRLPGALFQRLQASLTDLSKIQPLLANFSPGPGIVGFHVVSYDHMLTGARAFCNCAQQAHQKMLVEATSRAPGYASGSWPHKVIELLTGAAYLDGICHLCLSRGQSPEEAAKRYGSSAQKGFEGFIDQVMSDTGVDRRTARGEIKQVLGLSRWVREAELYALVRDLFDDQRVLREASPEWLGRMRLDIYLPELKLAIEHQGEQHYRPIAAFGGEEAYARVVARDELKRKLCRANGVEVVEVRFDAPLTQPSLRQRLKSYLPI